MHTSWESCTEVGVDKVNRRVNRREPVEWERDGGSPVNRRQRGRKKIARERERKEEREREIRLGLVWSFGH